jgi:hypothetical protein
VHAKEEDAGDASATASGRGVETHPEPFEETWLPLTPELALVDPHLAEWARDQLPEAGLTESTRTAFGGSTGSTVAPLTLGVPQERPTMQVLGRPPLHHSPERDASPGGSPLPNNARRTWLRAVSLVLIGVGLMFALGSASPEDDVVGSTRSNVIAHTNSTAAGSAKPASHSDGIGSPSQSAPRPGQIQTPRVFIWAPVHGAAFYEFELFRRQVKIFEARSTDTRVALPTHWLYRGRRFFLVPGHYRWVVRPAVGSRRRGELGSPVVLAKLAVAR